MTDFLFPDITISNPNESKQKSSNSTKSIEVQECDELQMPIEVLHDLQFLKDFDEIEIGNCKESGKHQAFVKIEKKNGEVGYIRKASILWSWMRDKTRVSTDRIHRFIAEKNPVFKCEDKEIISLGDYACFEYKAESVIGHVVGFKYLAGRNQNYTLPYCPLKVPEGITPRGIGVLCALYLVGSDDLITKNECDYIDINNFISHVSIEFTNNQMKLSKESLDLIKF